MDERQYFRLRPSFLKRFLLWLNLDHLRIVLRDQHYLRDRGDVVWGYLVRADERLLSPRNRRILAAEVIYSPDTSFDDRVPVLHGAASRLAQLIESPPADEELEAFARVIREEQVAARRLPLPPSLGDGRDLFFARCLVQPSHLPGGCLANGLFPLVICPEKTDAVMILPERYWPDALRASFVAGGNFPEPGPPPAPERPPQPKRARPGLPRRALRALPELLWHNILPGTNLLGLVFFFFTGLAVLTWVAVGPEPLQQVLLGALLFLVDRGYRRWLGVELFEYERGARIAFLPVGIYRLVIGLIGMIQLVICLLE